MAGSASICSNSQSINVSSFGLGARSFCVAKYQRPGSGTEMSNGLTKRPLSRSRVQNGARAMADTAVFQNSFPDKWVVIKDRARFHSAAI